VMTVSTIAFFSAIGMSRFPWVAMVNLLPLPFFAAYWWMSRQAR
jgi:hypothetical protein